MNNNMKEKFNEVIEEALTAANVVSDVYQKSIALSTAAQAIAIFINNTQTSNNVQKEEIKEENVEEKTTENLIEDEIKVSEKNKKMIEEIDNSIKQAKAEKSKIEWELQYDENGIPFLNEEDRGIVERELAYQNALTDEVVEKMNQLAKKEGEKIVNEMENDAVKAFSSSKKEDKKTPEKGLSPEDKEAFEKCKSLMEYSENPDLLNTYAYNFTDGAINTIEDLTEEMIPVFLTFVREELSKYYEELENWKASWITKEGLDKLISEAYGIENGNIEELVNESNIKSFVEYVRLYSAQAFYNSWNEEMERADLESYVKAFLDDASATLESIDENNVIGFVNYVTESTSQEAC